MPIVMLAADKRLDQCLYSTIPDRDLFYHKISYDFFFHAIEGGVRKDSENSYKLFAIENREKFTFLRFIKFLGKSLKISENYRRLGMLFLLVLLDSIIFLHRSLQIYLYLRDKKLSRRNLDI